ncbi:Na+/H+ antiporter subunit E [Simiduia litorea]|uniref:Na+/H+ antiporter subunit E n=1 Tax=Simiduia litorea TaxID=1435348 RepID=UPI0036F38D3A
MIVTDFRYLQRLALLLLVLIVAWLLWSGIYKPLLIGLGAFSCLLSLYMAHRMGALDDSVYSWSAFPRLPLYWIWLLKEIALSSFKIAKIILSRDLPISPTLVVIDTLPTDPVGQVILGNSISLTPGSVTLDIYQGKLTAHCLTQAGAKALLEGEINRRVAALKGN